MDNVEFTALLWNEDVCVCGEREFGRKALRGITARLCTDSGIISNTHLVCCIEHADVCCIEHADACPTSRIPRPEW